MRCLQCPTTRAYRYRRRLFDLQQKACCKSTKYAEYSHKWPVLFQRSEIAGFIPARTG